MNLFNHKMLKTTTLGSIGIPCNVNGFFLDKFTIDIEKAHLASLNTCHLAVAHVVDVLGVFQNGRHI